MKRSLLSVAAFLALAGCTKLPDNFGPTGQCAEIGREQYDEARQQGGVGWAEVRLENGYFAQSGAGHDRKRCWPRTAGQGEGRENRRCVQRNDLVVEMQNPDAITYYRIPAGTTYLLFGQEGRLVCQTVVEE